MGMADWVSGRARRGPWRWLVGVWVLACAGVMVGGLMLADAAPAYAFGGDRLKVGVLA